MVRVMKIPVGVPMMRQSLDMVLLSHFFFGPLWQTFQTCFQIFKHRFSIHGNLSRVKTTCLSWHASQKNDCATKRCERVPMHKRDAYSQKWGPCNQSPLRSESGSIGLMVSCWRRFCMQHNSQNQRMHV